MIRLSNKNIIDKINSFFDKIEKGLEVANKFADEVIRKVVDPITKFATIIAVIALLLGKWDYLIGVIVILIFGQLLDLEKKITALRETLEDKSKNTPTSLT